MQWKRTRAGHYFSLDAGKKYRVRSRKRSWFLYEGVENPKLIAVRKSLREAKRYARRHRALWA